MENLIITRKLDELGRIVVPIEIRKKLGICEGQKLNIFIRNKNIIIGLDTKQENGVLATIDELGRILIFYQIRQKANVKAGQELNIYTENDEIILQKKVSSSIKL